MALSFDTVLSRHHWNSKTDIRKLLLNLNWLNSIIWKEVCHLNAVQPDSLSLFSSVWLCGVFIFICWPFFFSLLSSLSPTAEKLVWLSHWEEKLGWTDDVEEETFAFLQYCIHISIWPSCLGNRPPPERNNTLVVLLECLGKNSWKYAVLWGLWRD